MSTPRLTWILAAATALIMTACAEEGSEVTVATVASSGSAASADLTGVTVELHAEPG